MGPTCLLSLAGGVERRRRAGIWRCCKTPGVRDVSWEEEIGLSGGSLVFGVSGLGWMRSSVLCVCFMCFMRHVDCTMTSSRSRVYFAV